MSISYEELNLLIKLLMVNQETDMAKILLTKLTKESK